MSRRSRAVVVTVQDASRGSAVPARSDIERWARSALAEGVRGEVTVRIVGEAESAELNSRYRDKKGPTNVLSFSAEPATAPSETAPELLPFGDLVICADVVEREAREQGKAPAAHWAHMVVHGALHLQGFDHENVRDASIMEQRERKLLAALGFPDPYSIK
jgi:probable rRNA maturation factor